MRALETAHRLFNGVRKVLAGLRPFNESVWPGVRNDLFVAHESIYRFFATHTKGRRVLDAGCGAGYGSQLIRESGAATVVGVDIDASSVRYAQRHFADANVRFDVGDLEHLRYDDASFDVVVASNSLEHLDSPQAFLTPLRRILKPGGIALLAIPPIYTAADVAAHSDIHYHRNQLHVTEWIALLERNGFAVRCLSHRIRPGVPVDFTSHAPTRLSTSDFSVVEVSRDELLTVPSVSVIFEANRSSLAAPDVQAFGAAGPTSKGWHAPFHSA